MHIACLMMLKNEEKRLRVTLASLRSCIDSLIIYDTGSTDSTLDILREFNQQTNIPLHLKQGEFVNFCTSRNISLDFADTIEGVDFLLLLDCNDEIKNHKHLRTFLKKQPVSKTAWLVKQSWYHGTTIEYYNIRLIRPKQQWRYQGVVHEWIQKQDGKDIYIDDKLPEVVIYQDRTLDDDKTGKRFHRDKELLMDEHERNPTDARTVFYLAQTLSCLGELKEAYEYYKKRSVMEGFIEEQFQSYLRMGELVKKLLPGGHKDFNEGVMTHWFLKAFEHTPRVEPLLELGEHYRMKQNWHMAYMFASMACSLPPTNCILFVDEKDYTYKRYHLLGIVAWYACQYEVGYNACLQALKNGSNPTFKEIDQQNLKFYKEKLGIQIPSEPAMKIGNRRRRR